MVRLEVLKKQTCILLLLFDGNMFLYWVVLLRMFQIGSLMKWRRILETNSSLPFGMTLGVGCVFENQAPPVVSSFG